MDKRLITLTNDGYKEITSNMMHSLKQFNLLSKLTVFCLDSKVQEYLQNLYPDSQYEIINNTGS